MSAPEKIWIDTDGYWSGFDPSEIRTVIGEYTRTDLSQASVAAALEAAADKLSREWPGPAVDIVRALITPDQRTSLQAAIDAAVAEARAEDARARGYSSAADVSDIVEAFRIAGPIALADFKSHPFILNDKEEAAVALITATLNQIGAKP